MALQDYTIDTSGTPQDVQRRQAYADALLKQGADFSPVQSPWQGAARLAQGLLGGYERGQAAQEEQQGRAAYQQRLAAALQGGNGSVSPQAMIQLAGDPWANPAQTQAITHVADMQAQKARQAVEDQHWAASYGLQKEAAARAQYEFEHTPDQYIPNPKAGQPGEPQYIDQYAQATAAAGRGKPIPYETLSGTKFLIPQPGGGYSSIDPRTIGQSAPVAAGMPPAVPGSPPAASPAINGSAPPTSSVPPTAQPTTPDVEAIDPKTGRREGYLQSLEPQVQDYIKKVADYEIDPRTTSVKGGAREQLMSAVAKYDPTYNQNDFSSRAKAIKDFGTGQQGNAIRSFDVATDHLETLQKYADALKSGDIRVINSIRNAWMKETGSELPTNVQAVAPIVGAEVSKAIIGSNNALADREELRAPLNAANSPAQLSGAIQGYKALMAGQLQGLKKQYEDTTGKKDFDHRLRQNTLDVLSKGEAGPANPLLQQAKEAISQGAPRDKVIERLKQAGVDPSGL